MPLVLVGFYNLWGVWQASKRQLNESIEQQAELAATALEQWVHGQEQTLLTISMMANAGDQSDAALKSYLSSVLKTRPNWLEVEIVNAAGETVLRQSRGEIRLEVTPVENLRQLVERKNALVIFAEQPGDANLRLISAAQPIPSGGLVVARIDGASASQIFERLELPEENVIAVFDEQNRLLYRNRISPEQVAVDVSYTPLLSALNNKDAATIEIESPFDKIQRVYGLARRATGGCVVAVGVPSAKLYQPASELLTRHLLFGSLVTVLAIFAAYLIARSIAQPIRQLSESAEKFGAGDLTARAKVAGKGSIPQLAATFNQMAEQIKMREEQLRELDTMKSEFVSNVSHELRTPLTTIKTMTRVLQRGNLDEIERREYLETIAAECDRQIEFVQTLLDLSRIEAGAYKVSLTKTDVVKLLWEAVEAAQKTAITHGLNLRFLPPPSDLPPALTDAGALRRIVSSLIENAMKYTPEGGAIQISTIQRGEQIAIEITDNGCGIAAQDLPYIFEKFYRGKPLDRQNLPANGDDSIDEETCSALNETSGIGLGLYLVHSLVKEIGGEIAAESPVEQTRRGTKFTLLLPVYIKPDE